MRNTRNMRLRNLSRLIWQLACSHAVKRAWPVALLIILCTPFGAVAQKSALAHSDAPANSFAGLTVSGTVVDRTNAAVSGATVVLRGSKRESERSTMTDAQGHFEFAPV